MTNDNLFYALEVSTNRSSDFATRYVKEGLATTWFKTEAKRFDDKRSALEFKSANFGKKRSVQVVLVDLSN